MRPGQLLIAVAVVTMASCKPYRIEYVDVPDYYVRAAAGGLPDRVTLDDGTVRVYRVRGRQPNLAEDEPEKAKPFELRETRPDGTVILHARLPEHVIAQTASALQTQEYTLFYDQMLSNRTKDELEAQGEGYDEFVAFFTKNRKDLLTTLNRMMFGMVGRDVVMERVEGKVIRMRLRPQVARDFKFTYLDIVTENGEMRLLTIR